MLFHGGQRFADSGSEFTRDLTKGIQNVFFSCRLRPYLIGSVRYLEDAPAQPHETASLAQTVWTAFRVYTAKLRGDGDEDAGDDEPMPDDPELLAYLVAASLQVETARRQQLLELDDTTARLRGCLALLRREAVLLDRMLSQARPPAAMASLN